MESDDNKHQGANKETQASSSQEGNQGEASHNGNSHVTEESAAGTSSDAEARTSEEMANEREVSLDGEADVSRELAEYKDKYLRALADFQNLRERSARERTELLKYQGEPLLADIIPVLDNLELALQYAESDPQKILEGMRMIHKQFTDALDKWGVRGVSGLGEPFDPQKQNAISKVPSKEAAAGTVLQELKKAYFYKERLIRAGEVVVSEGDESSKS